MKNSIVSTSNVNDLLFPVRMEDSEEIFGIEANKDYEKAVIATIDGTDRILNVCSDRYQLVSNEDIFLRIHNELKNQNVDFSEKYEIRNNAVFTGTYVIEDDNYSIGVDGDKIKPRFTVTHSYNGLAKYKIVFGYFRLICSNGLVIPYEGTEESNLMIVGKHTKKIMESLDMLMEKLENFRSKTSEYAKRYEVLFDTKVENYGERVETVMESVGIKKGVDDVLATIRTEMSTLDMDTANDWLIYNGINRLIFDNDQNIKSNEVRYELDKKVMAEIMK